MEKSGRGAAEICRSAVWEYVEQLCCSLRDTPGNTLFNLSSICFFPCISRTVELQLHGGGGRADVGV